MLQKLFGSSQKKITKDSLVPLLNCIARPLTYTAKDSIMTARRHIPDEEGRRCFMQLLMHVCLASTLARLDCRNVAPKGMSKAFKDFAISGWDRPAGVSVESDYILFEYTQRQIGDKLLDSSEDAMADVGLTLLSIALPDCQQFTTEAAIACAQAAQECWRQAAVEANKQRKVPLKINAESAKIDRQVYLLNYTEHYSDILGRHLTRKRLAELFLFRAWTVQFGYRIFSSDHDASEKLIGETVNAAKYIGLGMFQLTHGFSVESELGAKFIPLIEDRWRGYDLVVSTMGKQGQLPTMDIIAALVERLQVADPAVTIKLSVDFLAQINLIKRTAMEIGLLPCSRD